MFHVSTSRRSDSDSLKADAVRRHLLDKVPVSDLADELKFQPSMIHLWVRQLLSFHSVQFTPLRRRDPVSDPTYANSVHLEVSASKKRDGDNGVKTSF